MQKEEFYKLLDRYLEGNAGVEDEATLDRFSNYLIEDNRQHLFTTQAEKENIYNRLFAGVSSGIRKQKRKTRIKIAFRAAASIVLLVAIGLGVYFGTQVAKEQPPVYLTLTTKYGQQANVTLSDGSVVTLNAGSVLKYPREFDSKERAVTLQGEAFFEVTKDKKRPFSIASGRFKTTVLGTSFNIKAYKNERQSVTVATGKVYVQSAGATAYILPNQQVTIAEDGNMNLSRIAADNAYGWKNNIIRLDNTSLGELLLTLRRQYGVGFVLTNPELKNCRFTGRFENAKLNEVLESLKYMNGIEYRYIDSNKVALKGSCGPID